MTSSNIGRDKSFVDDLNKERGIVRLRVAFVPRSAEIQPSFCRFVAFTFSLFSGTFLGGASDGWEAYWIVSH